MQGSEVTPKAPLGNNARPLQQLHHRTVRTNIDFPSIKVNKNKINKMKKNLIKLNSNRIKIVQVCTKTCIIELINGQLN